MSVVRLSIELVPRGAWFQNLRSMLPDARWDELRRETYRRVRSLCEICGGKGPNHPVECHEQWEYDDRNHVAKLTGLLGLCPACHECKHIGLAQVRGRFPQAMAHLAAVNGMSGEEAGCMVREAFRVWQERSLHEWTNDIGWSQRNNG